MKNLIFTIILIIITGCGFKIVDLSEKNKFNIAEINTVGEKRINYIIKNNLKKIVNNSNKTKISVFIKTEKERIIKEKNIKNEITKYEIVINNLIEVVKIDENKKYNFTISEAGVYDVSSQNSETRNNEKNLIKVLSEKLVNRIISEINIQLNDT